MEKGIVQIWWGVILPIRNHMTILIKRRIEAKNQLGQLKNYLLKNHFEFFLTKIENLWKAMQKFSLSMIIEH